MTLLDNPDVILQRVDHQDGRSQSVRVPVAEWFMFLEFLREELDCHYFSFLSGVDWLPNPDLDGERTYTESTASGPRDLIVEAPPRVAGGTSRFQVMARVANLESHQSFIVFADLDDDQPSVESITPLYAGADWHERETWEMYGFEFVGHPGLRHLYLPGEFEGHPLRKDFPLLAREVRPWPGLVDLEEMPIADESNGSLPEGGDS